MFQANLTELKIYQFLKSQKYHLIFNNFIKSLKTMNKIYSRMDQNSVHILQKKIFIFKKIIGKEKNI